MFENLVDIHEKLSALERQLSDPELLNNRTKYQETVREHSRVSKLNELYTSYTKVGQDLADNRELIHDADNDPELAELAKGELEELTEQQAELAKKISLLLLPPDPNDEKTSFWRSAPVPAVTRQPSLLPTSFVCFPGMRKHRSGKLRS